MASRNFSIWMIPGLFKLFYDTWKVRLQVSRWEYTVEDTSIQLHTQDLLLWVSYIYIFINITFSFCLMLLEWTFSGLAVWYWITHWYENPAENPLGLRFVCILKILTISLINIISSLLWTRDSKLLISSKGICFWIWHIKHVYHIFVRK